MEQNFLDRYKKLNENQKKAVDTIFGPVMVVAGPGTGKTELLSMRAAQILRLTDALPSNILCLTYTNAGVSSMRKRLHSIIGETSYQVQINTFHSFCTELMNDYQEYFFDGEDYRLMDELTSYETMLKIQQKLPHNHKFAKTPIATLQGMVTDLKKSGLSIAELEEAIEKTTSDIKKIEDDIIGICSGRMSVDIVEALAGYLEKLHQIKSPKMPQNTMPFIEVFTLSLQHAIEAATAEEKIDTKPVTAWKGEWLKGTLKTGIYFKDLESLENLKQAIDVYRAYNQALQDIKMYDFDDMIIKVIHAIEKYPTLRAELQEKYQYIMVDEFQDTNLMQMRILRNLAPERDANLMVVGDDDQSIYSFQGAEIGNIQTFLREFKGENDIIVLTDNYRSAKTILELSRRVILLNEDRLENVVKGLSKELTGHFQCDNEEIVLLDFNSTPHQYQTISQKIADLIASGVKAQEIAVIATKHDSLKDFSAYLNDKNVDFSYSKSDNCFENPLIVILYTLSQAIIALADGNHDLANSLLPKILAEPALGFQTNEIFKLSLDAYRQKKMWLELMQENPHFSDFADWLIYQSVASQNKPMEVQLDEIFGSASNDEIKYQSPIYKYYFSPDQLQQNGKKYLEMLEALTTVRGAMRDYYQNQRPKLRDFEHFCKLYQDSNQVLAVEHISSGFLDGKVNLLTAHGSKGLEFEYVFIIDASDSQWVGGGGNKKLRYPTNMPFTQKGTIDEKNRLFFVSITRAKKYLSISFSSSQKDKTAAIVRFASEEENIIKQTTKEDAGSLVKIVEIDWRKNLLSQKSIDLAAVLQPRLEQYKLSATDLNAFLDLNYTGPTKFLFQNLLRMPGATSDLGNYGTAIHVALQWAHIYFKKKESLPAIDEIIAKFEENLRQNLIDLNNLEKLLVRGRDSLIKFMNSEYAVFNKDQLTEFNLSNQGIEVEGVRLTGKLDLLEVDRNQKQVVVTDYKTGKPEDRWSDRSTKLRGYSRQLMFYQILIENSRSYRDYTMKEGILQFVETNNSHPEVVALRDSYDNEQIERLLLLMQAVWQKIMNLDFPDTTEYGTTIDGVIAFENDLIDGKI